MAYFFVRGRVVYIGPVEYVKKGVSYPSNMYDQSSMSDSFSLTQRTKNKLIAYARSDAGVSHGR
jgi:hypothetical protein